MELKNRNRVVLAFGSNLGDKEKNIELAIELININCGSVTQISPYYKSKAMGFDSENDFINGCLLLQTDLPPLVLLGKLQQIEKELGRIKNKDHYQDRTIDLDIIFYESLCINLPELQIPHPRYQERPFVLEPLKTLHLDSFNF
jgi:2-amino-4-hydroxy-6-hydroxymethyldihydropteridine diphosphokinase